MEYGRISVPGDGAVLNSKPLIDKLIANLATSILLILIIFILVYVD